MRGWVRQLAASEAELESSAAKKPLIQIKCRDGLNPRMMDAVGCNARFMPPVHGRNDLRHDT
jgi:hypothetical protein